MELNKEGLQLLLDTGLKQAGVLSFTGKDGSASEPFVILPGGTVQSVSHLGAPTRVKQTVALIDAGSFCDYVNRFKNPDSLIFAAVTETGAKLTAILDYHGAPVRPQDIEDTADAEYSAYCAAVGGKAFNGDVLPNWAEFRADPNKKTQSDAWIVATCAGINVGESVDPQPKYTNHRATLELVQTPDWKAWLAADRKVKPQGDFAMWLEEFAHLFNHKDCVIKGAELLELISTLYAKQDVSFDTLIRLQTAGFSCNYQENTAVGGSIASGKVELPPIIQAGVQPFEGGPTYRIDARLKVKIADRKLHLWLETVQLQKTVRDSVLETVKMVSERTGIIPLIGTAA
jgi:uncharacterized protein YfdQ (DUF2303 family)